MITLDQIAKSYGPQTLFEGVSVQMTAGHCYGFVGANGSGKSTLLKIISGEVDATAGTVSMPKRIRVGVLSQDHFRYEQNRIVDVVMMGHPELWEAMVEKERILALVDETGEFDMDRFGELEDRIVQHDGYGLESRAGEILEGLNIPSKVHEEPLSVLSGGFKLRALMAQTLASEPDVLLLDEPTNHLDILSIRWLERFLESYRGCAVVVSHDHRFLDNVCSHIVDVDYEQAILYPGNYTAFAEAKIANRERKESEIAKREAVIADQKKFIERFKAKATKARQAQSRVKRIAKIQIERLAESSRRYPKIRFEMRRPSGKEVLRVEGLSKAYDAPVLQDVSFSIRRGDRLAIIGPNGIGKSTLLKILIGEVPEDAGEHEWGYEVQPGYFAQDQGAIYGDGSETVLNRLWDTCPERGVGEVRSRLAAVLFDRHDVEKRVSSLSGGEMARLGFACLAVDGPNILVLDEPTNHLDLEGIEALAAALNAYEGTVILVAHDRWFVSQVATRILEIRADGVEDYQGSYEEYVASSNDDHLDFDEATRRARRAK
jgi:ATPase subunit of ABC transporter with duplicated ATPase domains